MPSQAEPASLWAIWSCSGGIAVAFGPERRPALAHRDRVQPFHCIVGVAGHDSVGKRSGCQPTVRVIPVAGQSRVALADGLDLTVTVMFLSGYSILVMGESVRNLCVEPSQAMKTKFPVKNMRNTATPLRLIASIFVLAVFASMGEAATISKANNTDDLNLSTSWVGGTVPGTSDVAAWEATVTSASSTVLGADLSWAGIGVNSTAGGNVTIGGTANTLTLGSSGIAVGASRSLTLSSLVSLDAAQTWNGTVIVNGTTITNNGNTLTLNGQINLATNLTGTGGITKNGSGTVSISGHSTYTGTTTINAGIFQLTGASSSIASTSAVTGSGGSIRLFWTGNATRTFANTISGSINLQKFTTNNIVELTGANTYAGKTSISGGGLSVASLNSVSGGTLTSSLGAPVTVADGTIDVGLTTAGTTSGTGTLIYTGSGETTDRVINLSGMHHGAVLDQSGTGLLKLTSDFTATGKGSKALTLQGSTASAGEISGAIVNNGTNGNTTLVTAFAAGASTITLGSVDGISVGASISGTGIAGGTTVTAIDAGTRTVTLSANTNGAGAFGNTITVDDVVNLTSVIKNGSGTWTLSGQNTYTGNTTINSGTLILAEASETLFVIGLDGVNNQILGSGTVQLDGAFVFDLNAAGTTLGDSWAVVDVTNLSETFGSSFEVKGFTDMGSNIWKTVNAGTTYQFSEITGVLTVVPEPTTMLLLAVGLCSLAMRRRRRA